MAFQFLCPQGHLLEGDESQSGEQAQCPYCSSVFLIPQPIPTAQADPSTVPPPVPPEAGFQAPSFEQGPVPPPLFRQPPFEPRTFEPPTFEPPALEPPAADAPAEPEAAAFPGIRTETEAGPGDVAQQVPVNLEAPRAADLPVAHVDCPNGHTLETPREMLDQDALCPFCQVQFRLRLEDSIEYREEKAKEQERRELRAGQMWLRWAIAAAVVVVLGLILLNFLSPSG